MQGSSGNKYMQNFSLTFKYDYHSSHDTFRDLQCKILNIFLLELCQMSAWRLSKAQKYGHEE